MSSSSSSPSSATPKPNEPQQPENNENNNPSSSSSSTSRLALPEVPPAGSAQTLDVGGQGSTVSLDHLGPIVVNTDGSMSRISNWEQMTEMEQKTTLRIVGKRNQQRLQALRAAGVEGST
ncbi:uncharacterized protein TRUGW13939_03464 [Talaromyces rugulosus]|uniref:Uncharacterized protein n=1 Tax=Talaromyces rugulosus TaxID=121627 RepID=A0A7H8QTM8_TALRU|nr:uncharacterized protein TRUGW13939_03464 [Talaromyces rugulosus]QKX56363.1 hypothetical protein TRUGW13939_03464 [Talaromyces rugulosus]